jgi:hypothetical protein
MVPSTGRGFGCVRAGPLGRPRSPLWEDRTSLPVERRDPLAGGLRTEVAASSWVGLGPLSGDPLLPTDRPTV